MAQLRAIVPPRCRRCDKPAVVRLYSKRGHEIGVFCHGCGAVRLKDLQMAEDNLQAAEDARP